MNLRIAQSARRNSTVGPPIWLALGLAALATISANPLLTFAGALVLLVLVALLWRPGEPPILLFAAGFQWLQVVTKIVHGDLIDRTVDDMFGGDSVVTAIWLSLAGLIALAIGMRFGAGGRSHAGHFRVTQQCASLSLRGLWIAYILAYGGGIVLSLAAEAFPSLTQPLLSLADVKWFFLYLLAAAIFTQERSYNYLIIVFVIEIITGLIGYFAGFRQVFFVTFIAYGTVRPELSAKRILPVGVIMAMLVALAIAWTAVKTDYRNYLNQGSHQQVVLVGVSERLGTLKDMVLGLQPEELGHAFERMVERIAYVDYFAYTIAYVPRIIEHTNGELWSQSIAHVLMPRVFFPDKSPLPSDSELTMQYTGLRLASDREGTSISIGYMGESYIDFGSEGMFVPIAFVGLILGLIYRWFISHRDIYGDACAVIVLIRGIQYETAGIKLVGSVLTSFIVAVLWYKLLTLIVKPSIANPNQKRI